MARVVKQLRVRLLACSFLVLLPMPAFVQSDSAQSKPNVERREGQHDFDFEFGEWKVDLSRRLRPLTGSASWVKYDGKSVVRRVWNGRANLGELNVDGREGHIEGLSLRLYNPRTHQWNISWANSSDGILGQPMIGEFKNGRGEFFNQEPLNGRAIFVRFVFSDVTPNSFRLEQAFSDDGGTSWEPNWIAKFTRTKESRQ
jgi:hypothetical protein